MPTRSKPANKKRTSKKKTVSAKFSVGREAFVKISSVEGIVMTREMRSRTEEFDRKRMTAAQRRSAIIKLYKQKA
jgi:hypothetical protein